MDRPQRSNVEFLASDFEYIEQFIEHSGMRLDYDLWS